MVTKYEKQIAALERHAAVANEEMGVIKNDITWIKEKLNEHIKREDEIFATLFSKIDGLNLGVPVWMVAVGSLGGSIIAGLIVYIVTK